jgi:hypothetical protein
MNSHILGKDPQGRCWFKSDQYLTDITDSTFFYVKKVGWWRQYWHLIAVIVKRPAYYRDNVNMRGYVPAVTEEKVLGHYDKEISASLAMEELMRLKGITQIDPF